MTTNREWLLATIKDGTKEIELKPGLYGDMTIDKPVKLYGERDAVFNTMRVVNKGSGASLEGFSLTLAPTTFTGSADAALRVVGTASAPVTNLTVKGLKIEAGYSPPDTVGNQAHEGELTARGVTLYHTSDVLIDGCEIKQCQRGLVVEYSSRVAIVDNHIHHLRMTPIYAANFTDLAIEDNRIHTVKPWAWNTGPGDHGDFIHTRPSAVYGPLRRLRIVGNEFNQGEGVAILGLYLDDNGLKVGYEDVFIVGNRLNNSNLAGMRLEYVLSDMIAGNALLPTRSGTLKQAPTIIGNTGAWNNGPPDHLRIFDNILAWSEPLRPYGPNMILTPGLISQLMGL